MCDFHENNTHNIVSPRLANQIYFKFFKILLKHLNDILSS